MTKLGTLLFACAASFFCFSATGYADDFIIDVRTQEEYESGHVENSINIACVITA